MDERDDLFKFLGLDENGEPPPLHPHLRPYITSAGVSGTPALKHPLVFSLPYASVMNDVLNQQYMQTKKAVQRAEDEGNWYQYIFLHERPHRLEAFMRLAVWLSDEAYWNLLGDIWTDSENIWQNKELWSVALSSDRGYREHMMEKDDRKMYAGLDPQVTIYRGTNAPDRMGCGMSWTLDPTRAEWFARRLIYDSNLEPTVVTAKVEKRNVIAYLGGREEEEVVALPQNIVVLGKETLP